MDTPGDHIQQSKETYKNLMGELTENFTKSI